MDQYREYVAGIANGEWPSQTISNRSAADSAVTLEFLFRKAEREIEILTSHLSKHTFGESAVIEAAIDFLQRSMDGTISILTENPVDRRTHPFLAALDSAGFAERVHVKPLGTAIRKNYKFNFSIADKKSFRLEEDRDFFDAIVGFGHERMSRRLHHIFSALSHQPAIM